MSIIFLRENLSKREHMINLRIVGFVILMFILTIANLPFQVHATGELVKGSSAAVYYIGSDGKRYAFPSSRVYFSWYSDFSSVETITENQLASYPLGGNVTYRPGYKLVKIESDPKVYAIDNGAYLRWVTSETLAKTLFGDDWSTQVDDIPVTLFLDYIQGPEISSTSDYNINLVRVNSSDIDDDRIRWKAQRISDRKKLTASPDEEEEIIVQKDTTPSITLTISDVTATSVTITWKSSGLADLKFFVVEKNSLGAQTNTTAGMYTDTQVEPSTTYRYQVHARSIYGGNITSSNEVVVTTPES